MKDEDKTKEQLINELTELRRRNAEWKRAEDEIRKINKELEQKVEERTRDLGESEDRYRRIVDLTSDYIYTVYVKDGRPERTVHHAGCAAVTGYKPGEHKKDPSLWYKMIHEEDREAVVEENRKVLSGNKVSLIEHRIIHRDGSLRWVRNTLVPHFDEEGNLVSYDGVISDITGRKEMEEKLIRQEKLAAVGQLAGSVSHELRNPLSVIGNSVYYLKMKLRDSDVKVRKHLDILEREMHKSNRIITDLLDFSRVREPELQKADMNGIVGEVLESIKIRDNISVETRLGEGMPLIPADPDQMQQVFMNLIYNACQAMPEGGRLGIETGLGDGFAEVAFKDTGDGIPEENLQKIFEPLFTRRTRGIGLGLAIARSIVDGHNGKIEVESEVGKGSKFTVKLPLK